MIDTFRYQLKGEEIDITFIQKSTNLKFLKNRFKIKNYKTSNITLVRAVSSDVYIKITK